MYALFFDGTSYERNNVTRGIPNVATLQFLARFASFPGLAGHHFSGSTCAHLLPSGLPIGSW